MRNSEVINKISNLDVGERIVYHTSTTKVPREIREFIATLYETGTHIPHVKRLTDNIVNPNEYEYCIRRVG